MGEFLLGIDIGGTKCAVVLGRAIAAGKMEIRGKRSFPTENERGADHVVAQIFSNVEALLTHTGLCAKDLRAVGISCGGPLDELRGIVQNPPNLPGWDEVPIVKLVEARLGVPAKLQNDANACALAEWKYGAAKGFDNVVFLTFGTGLGAGLILDGKLYTGTKGMAGEVGHIRLADFGPVGYGKAGSLEGFCSGGGIAQLAQLKALECFQLGESCTFCPDIAHLRDISAKTVAEAAFAGDKTALEVFATCGRFLGRGLSVLIDILAPEIIVLGSVYERSRALLVEEMQKALAKEALPRSLESCRVAAAGLGDEIGDYAALAVADVFFAGQETGEKA